MLIEELDLTDEQVEKMQKVRVKYDKKEIDLHANSKKLNIDREEAMKDMDYPKAKKLIIKISKIKTDIQLMHIDHKEEISKLLNKEQLEKFRKLHRMRNRSGKKDVKKWKKNKKYLK